MAWLSRREGLQLMLGGACVVLLATTACQARRSSAAYDGPEVRSDRPPTVSEVGGYTPFPFVTISNPSLSHAGVAARPGYSPTDPPSASIIDPMSGIELFRVGGNLGDTLFINGTTNSGFVFPRVLRNENNSKGFKVWNADGTLLMIDRYFSRSADSGLNVAKSYLIDVSGTHGASAPWRIIRVNPTGDDLSGPAGTTAAAWWFWDPLNPLRAYAIYHDGRLAEWWPIGGPGHSEGELNVLYGEAKLPSGFSSVHGGAGRPNACTPTSDGKYRVIPCQRSSDGRWGGFRQNLFTGEIEDQFVVSPDYGGSQSFITDNNRDAKGVSELGNYTSFTPNGNRHTFKNLVTGATVSDTDPDHNTMTHTCHIVRNGMEYFGGVRTNNVSLWRIETGSIEEKVTEAQFQGANPNHLGAQAWNDTFEAHGANGSGGTSGIRYLLYSRAGPRNGHPRALMGIRCGPNDLNQFRFICNHRSVRADNSDECHPQMDPDARHVVFPTNWKETGHPSTGDGTVFPMIAALPDAWRSPNNDGS